MKSNIFFSVMALAVIALVSNVSWAKPKNIADWPIELFETMDNSKLIIFVKDKDIMASKQWNPAAGTPPMSIATVLTHVNEWVLNDKRLAGLGVNEIELKPINNYKNHWYYLVKLTSVNDTKRKPNYIAVLFSGKVVPAMVEPSSIK